jgi:hypothetical protein
MSVSRLCVQTIYAAVAVPSPYFVIPMFVTEAIPILTVTFLLRPKNVKRFVISSLCDCFPCFSSLFHPSFQFILHEESPSEGLDLPKLTFH